MDLSTMSLKELWILRHKVGLEILSRVWWVLLILFIIWICAFIWYKKTQ